MTSEGAAEPRVDVIVVNWKGRPFLPRCLTAIEASSIRTHTIVVDNASGDGSAEYVSQNHPDAELLLLKQNHGYAGGANVGLEAATAPFAMILNPDVILAPDHLEILVARMTADPSMGAAQGKLYRISPSDFQASRLARETVDSAGHVIRRTRMVFDRGQGEPDDGRWDHNEPVFSASGAAILLRRDMLEDLASGSAPFDPMFFAYKEDIDLCWRARLRGWEIRYVPEAVAWHVRAVPGPGQKRSGAPARARRHSWMNHWLMMLKNDRGVDVIRHLPWVLGWELARVGHALFRDPALLPAYLGIWTRVPAALRARREIQDRRLANPSEIRAWFRSGHGSAGAAPIDATPPREEGLR